MSTSVDGEQRGREYGRSFGIGKSRVHVARRRLSAVAARAALRGAAVVFVVVLAMLSSGRLRLCVGSAADQLTEDADTTR